jgi:UDP-N-acetylmuramoylalanine--D-glutamate ligase
VIGFGRAGQALTRFLAREGAQVYVSDRRNRADLREAELGILADHDVLYEGGTHSFQFLEQADFIVLSPGVDPTQPVLQQLAEAGIELVGELGLAASRLKAPVIAITGTNGKTTVTELAGRLLEEVGLRTFIGGNIGTPIGEYLLAEREYDVVVLEVSSFQLELSGDFSPEVAVLLNLSPDHLDRHGSTARYAAAKMRVFQGNNATRLGVLNGDDPLLRDFSHYLGPVDRYSYFGQDAAHDAVYADHLVTLRLMDRAQVYDLTGSSMDSLTGGLNVAAALLAVSPFMDNQVAVQTVLRDFQLGAHRMQLTDRIDGVTYINDSKATNSGAVISGLEQCAGPVILIAGGRDKGDNYRLLRAAIRNHVKHLLLIGEAARSMGAELADLVETSYPADLDEAVRQAASLAGPGDTVLLSPACASFDMFSSYIERGERFMSAVRGLHEVPALKGAV